MHKSDVNTTLFITRESPMVVVKSAFKLTQLELLYVNYRFSVRLSDTGYIFCCNALGVSFLLTINIPIFWGVAFCIKLANTITASTRLKNETCVCTINTIEYSTWQHHHRWWSDEGLRAHGLTQEGLGTQSLTSILAWVINYVYYPCWDLSCPCK